MTKEEAKRFWLIRYENAKDFSDPHWEAQERREHREYVEALCIAISALSAEAVSREEYEETDGVITIEKQSAKDVGEIKHIVIHSPNYTRYFYNENMPTSYIDAPSAEAVQGWIPCSEMLPDVGEIVIASWSDLWSDAIVFARRYCEDDWEWAYEQGSDYWESARDYDRESNPEAWMPLPEPYEPKTERRE